MFRCMRCVLGKHEESMSAFEEALRIDPGLFERKPEGQCTTTGRRERLNAAGRFEGPAVIER